MTQDICWTFARVTFFVAVSIVLGAGLVGSEARAQPCNPAVQTCT